MSKDANTSNRDMHMAMGMLSAFLLVRKVTKNTYASIAAIGLGAALGYYFSPKEEIKTQPTPSSQRATLDPTPRANIQLMTELYGSKGKEMGKELQELLNKIYSPQAGEVKEEISPPAEEATPQQESSPAPESEIREDDGSGLYPPWEEPPHIKEGTRTTNTPSDEDDELLLRIRRITRMIEGGQHATR